MHTEIPMNKTENLGPHAGAPFHTRLVRLLETTDKKNYEIAEAIGNERSKGNIISMFKKGHTRVPLNAVPKLAKVFDEPTDKLISLWYQQYEPDIAEVLFATKPSPPGPATEAERRLVVHVQETPYPISLSELLLIEALRMNNGGDSLSLSTSERKRIAALANALPPETKR